MELYVKVSFALNCLGTVLYFMSIAKGDYFTELDNRVMLIASVVFAVWSGTILF